MLPARHTPRRVLVTGGSGFIGAHVVHRLLDLGAEVRVGLLPDDPALALDGLDVERVEMDVLDRSSVARACRGCDTVFHLAAIYAIWAPDPDIIYRVNVHGSIHVAEAAAEAGVRRFVHTSSIAAVGMRPDGVPSNEDVVFNRWSEANAYVMSKYVSELEVLRVSRQTGLPVVVVNPSFPLGPGDAAPTPTGELVAGLLERRYPFWVDGGVNIVDVRDVATGHVLAARRGRPGRRYLLAGHNVETPDIMQRVARLAGVPLPRLRLSRRTAMLAGTVAEAIADHVTHRRPRFARLAVAYVAERRLYFDAARARTELGFRTRPLDETLEAAIAWFRSERYRHMHAALQARA